jgi:secretory carrier-associated membrane protein
LITRLFQLWLVLAGTLIINLVACVFVLTSGASGGVSDLITSIVCVIFFAPSLFFFHAPFG